MTVTGFDAYLFTVMLSLDLWKVLSFTAADYSEGACEDGDFYLSNFGGLELASDGIMRQHPALLSDRYSDEILLDT